MATNLTASTTQPDLKTYTGNCHCGAFKYTFQHEKITSGMQCNCSYCHKKGYLLLFLNKSSSNFSILRGEDSLKTYTFNTHNLLHKFCPTCGTNVIASSKDEGKEGTKNMAVNLRTVQDLGVWGLENMKVDGKSIGGTYTIPEPLEHGLKAEEGEKIYSGNCHCGKAKIVIKSKALSEVEARECDCSICMRNACTFIYPRKSSVQISDPDGTLKTYLWGNKVVGQKFCGDCGVPLYSEMQPGAMKFLEGMEEGSDKYKDTWEKLNSVPVRLHVLNGVDWEGTQEGMEKDRPKVERVHGSKFGKEYKVDQ